MLLQDHGLDDKFAVCQELLQSYRVWEVLGFEHADASTTIKHAEHMMLRRDLEQVSDALRSKKLHHYQDLALRPAKSTERVTEPQH